MSVTSNEMKEIMETTPEDVVGYLNTCFAHLLKATYKLGNENLTLKTGTDATATPSYDVTYMDNVAISKATPKNGIITFNFKAYGVSISVSYRDDVTSS